MRNAGITHILKQLTHIYKQLTWNDSITHIYKQLTHIYKQLTRDGGITHIYKQLTRDGGIGEGAAKECCDDHHYGQDDLVPGIRCRLL